MKLIDKITIITGKVQNTVIFHKYPLFRQYFMMLHALGIGDIYSVQILHSAIYISTPADNFNLTYVKTVDRKNIIRCTA